MTEYPQLLGHQSQLSGVTDGMKRQKDRTLEDETPRLEGVQYATGEEQRAITNTPERRKQLGQCGHDA